MAFSSQPEAVDSARSSRPWWLMLVVVIVVVAMIGAGVIAVVGALSAPDAAAPPVAPEVVEPDSSGTDPALAKFYTQELEWEECGRSWCTRMQVPLDYDNPDEEVITLAVLRVPAQTAGQRRGSLVVNPGGPGGSGVEYAALGSLQFGKQLSDHFDIVGFDPRGVGASTPVQCADTAQLDELISTPAVPRNPAEHQQMVDQIAALGQGCLDRSGELAQHMSTVEAAQDMDILRALLGESSLDFLGASYGTFLGATYAELFPHRVGRFVLDGALDPTLDDREMSLAQARGFEVALRSFIAYCVDKGDCVLGDTVDAGAAAVKAFLDSLIDQPLPTDTDRELTYGWAEVGIWLPLYVDGLWPQLVTALEQAINDGNGSLLMRFGQMYVSRGTTSYDGNSIESLYAVNCSDRPTGVAPEQVVHYLPEFEEASPTFGAGFAYGLSACEVWPAVNKTEPLQLRAEGAAPILVIGTTRDPATPLEWAEALATQLASGHLLIRDGDGHTGFRQGNSCIDDAVHAYLIHGEVPEDGTLCDQADS